MSKQNWDVIVIGGGPAGFFAAIRCAELNSTLRVLILEKANQPLGKVLISGGGRCNVTHACFDPAELIQFYPRGANELRGAFAQFQPRDTVQWFESRGVRLKKEADGRMFPVTDSSRTIAECLIGAAKKLGVEIRLGAGVSGVEKNPQGGFNLTVRESRADVLLHAKKILFATGGDSASRRLIHSLGHDIIPPVPSLFTFNVKDKRIEGLAGISVEQATLEMETVITRGALLITHWGLSGPAALKCSAWGARILAEKNYRAPLKINWLNDFSFDKTLEVLTRHKAWKENARKKVSSGSVFSQIPLRLWKQLTAFAGEKNWADVSKAELRQMARELSAGEFMIAGKGQFKDEFVTCGGVNLREVDFKTMQSRVTENLFFAGEVLDIDGVTGGFNFQSAWTTGWLAGGGLSREQGR